MRDRTLPEPFRGFCAVAGTVEPFPASTSDASSAPGHGSGAGREQYGRCESNE